MIERDVDRVPVVSPQDRTRLVGVVSSTDIMALEEMRAAWRARRQRHPLV